MGKKYRPYAKTFWNFFQKSSIFECASFPKLGLLWAYKKKTRLVQIDLIVGNLVGQVELDKDVERLRRWRIGRELVRAKNIFKQTELKIQAKEKCRDMLHKTIKHVFV